jgi:hypothetical protein
MGRALLEVFSLGSSLHLFAGFQALRLLLGCPMICQGESQLQLDLKREFGWDDSRRQAAQQEGHLLAAIAALMVLNILNQLSQACGLAGFEPFGQHCLNKEQVLQASTASKPSPPLAFDSFLTCPVPVCAVVLQQQLWLRPPGSVQEPRGPEALHRERGHSLPLGYAGCCWLPGR